MNKKVSIYTLDSKGRGIARFLEKPIFVFNALPGEEVTIQNLKEKSKYASADSLEIFNKSKNRITPVCPLFGICGGCDIMHLAYETQLSFKEKKVRDTICKKLKKDILIESIQFSDLLYYRNKAIFKVEEKCGYYEKETHRLIPISKCYLVDPKINEILEIVQGMSLEGIYEVMIRCSKNTNESMVVFRSHKSICEDLILSSLKDKVTTILLYQNDYKILTGPGFIYEKLGNFVFKISPDSFFQVNTNAALKLYSIVESLIEKNDRVLDLYCGTGSIGIFVSDKASSILGVEINKQAIEDACENKKINHLEKTDFLCLNTSLFAKSLKDYDVVIVDPPRSGLDKKTISYLLKEEVSKVIYVSCDLMTLTRDLEILSSKYEIKKVIPVDLFPNTYHVECVCHLVLKDNS